MPHGGYHGTVKMGGNVIQQGGTGNDAGKLAPKDDKGQFIPFNTPLVNMPKKGSDRQPGLFAQTPADNLATIIDQKDILKFQPSQDRPGMNAYQDAIQNFRTSSPTNMAAYANRFPLTQFAMTGLPRIAMSMIPGGNVFSAIANAYQSGKENMQGGASAIADGFKGTVDGIRGLLPTSLGGANVPDEFVVKKNKSEIVNDSLDEPDFLNEATGSYFDTSKGFGTRMPNVPLIGDGAFNTQNQVDPNNQFDVAELTQKQKDFMNNPMQSLDFQSRDSLFNKVKQLEDGGFFGFGAQEPTTREEFEEFINSGGIRQAADGGMIEGGLASINNPDYQRLMGASNFGF